MKQVLQYTLLCLIVILKSSTGFAASFVDKGSEVFFPAEIASEMTHYKNFPVTWWNFLILDGQSMPESALWAEAQRVCDLLRQKKSPLVSAVECQQDISQYHSLLTDWVADYSLRHLPPGTDDLKKILDRALAKASLPINQDLLTVLRNDPLESYKELQTIAQKKLAWNLSTARGFFVNKQDQRIVIPLKLSFPPDQDVLTRELIQLYQTDCKTNHSCQLWQLVGPHYSTLENKDQIMKDVQRVSLVGVFIAAFFIVGLLFLKRLKSLFLFIPVLLGIGCAVWAVVLVFGSIHGLTLSFGTGIIGLAIDYGFLAIFNPDKKSAWKSNFMGYVTTCIVLFTLLLSQIPLLQQIMYFSLCGLSLGFLFICIFFKWFPGLSNVESFSINPAANRLKFSFVAFMVVGLAFFTFIPLNLEMSAFNFEGPQQKEMSRWLFKQFQREPPLFEMTRGEAVLDDAHKRLDWAQTNQIALENAAVFVPRLDGQKSNLAGWTRSFCHSDFFTQTLGKTENIFFKPWLDSLNCDHLKPQTLTQGRIPAYVNDFHDQGTWLHLWFPKNKIDVEKINHDFPQAKSFLNLVNLFPKIIAQELLWMAPLCLGGLVLLLFFYYRKALLVLSALLPFLTGLGLISWIYFFWHFDFSFISLIALLMVCGFSLDYGIFATDSLITGSNKNLNGVWTSLGLAAVTTITGFLPLVFCQHKVLVDLGQTLTIGMMGTLIGTFWGIPFLLKRFKQVPTKT